MLFRLQSRLRDNSPSRRRPARYPTPEQPKSIINLTVGEGLSLWDPSRSQPGSGENFLGERQGRLSRRKRSRWAAFPSPRGSGERGAHPRAVSVAGRVSPATTALTLAGRASKSADPARPARPQLGGKVTREGGRSGDRRWSCCPVGHDQSLSEGFFFLKFTRGLPSSSSPSTTRGAQAIDCRRAPSPGTPSLPRAVFRRWPGDSHGGPGRSGLSQASALAAGTARGVRFSLSQQAGKGPVCRAGAVRATWPRRFSEETRAPRDLFPQGKAGKSLGMLPWRPAARIPEEKAL